MSVENTFNAILEECFKGDHIFEVISSHQMISHTGASYVIRWCKLCGTLVKDEEYEYGKLLKKTDIKIPVVFPGCKKDSREDTFKRKLLDEIQGAGI